MFYTDLKILPCPGHIMDMARQCGLDSTVYHYYILLIFRSTINSTWKFTYLVLLIHITNISNAMNHILQKNMVHRHISMSMQGGPELIIHDL